MRILAYRYSYSPSYHVSPSCVSCKDVLSQAIVISRFCLSPDMTEVFCFSNIQTNIVHFEWQLRKGLMFIPDYPPVVETVPSRHHLEPGESPLALHKWTLELSPAENSQNEQHLVRNYIMDLFRNTSTQWSDMHYIFLWCSHQWRKQKVIGLRGDAQALDAMPDISIITLESLVVKHDCGLAYTTQVDMCLSRRCCWFGGQGQCQHQTPTPKVTTVSVWHQRQDTQATAHTW